MNIDETNDQRLNNQYLMEQNILNENEDIKNKLGQFNTTNYNYILQGLYIPKNIKKIIEPFVGTGSLLKYIDQQNVSMKKCVCYDIDPKFAQPNQYITFFYEFEVRDVFKRVPNYKNAFIVTNPPFVARNKSNNKIIFNRYGTNDYYKCFLKDLIKQKPNGGIIILPLNFFSSMRKLDIALRKEFLYVFDILRVNVFEEQVFVDTKYTICSFQFELKEEFDDIENYIDFYFFPSRKKYSFMLSQTNNFIIGGSILKLQQNNNIEIERLTKNNIKEKEEYITNCLLKCIDDNEPICLKISEQLYIDETENLTRRSYATLVIKPKLNMEQQKQLCLEFNDFLEKERNKYNSMFLTNYRESRKSTDKKNGNLSLSRKRITFSMAYRIINYIINSKVIII